MPALYLTPASISYLNQFILALVITAYLARRFFFHQHSGPSTSDRLLVFFFVIVSAFSLALFLEASLLPTERLMVVYTQSPLLALMLVALLQFAYVFPHSSAQPRLERWLALAVSMAYFIVELRIALWRFGLLNQAEVAFRPEHLDYAPAVLFAWTIFAFGRGTWQDWRNPAGRRFALIFIIPLGLVVLNILRSYAAIPHALYHITISVGVLLTIFLFVLNYLVSQPEATSLLIKFSGAILTGLLAVFGTVSWLVAPAYAAQYRPPLPDHRSMRFTPNNQGGYDVTEIPFHFESDLGRNLGLRDMGNVDQNHNEVTFDVAFYGRRYTSLFIHENGLLTFGQRLRYWNLEYRLSAVPIFFALALDLNPEANPEGGVYLRQEAERLIITYYRVRAFFHPQQEYTFQVILHADGRIDLTYHGLPDGPQYQVNDRMDAAPWLIGAKPGLATGEVVNLAQLPLASGPAGVLDDQYRAFRRYLHDFLMPLATAILVSNVLFLLALHLMLNSVMAQPLRTLLAGVERFNREQQHQPIPVRFNDDVGFLTQSFNNLTSELDNLIQTLETRVADRTADLLASNTELRKLSIAVEQSPSIIMITNPLAEIEYVNPAFTRSTGYTFEEVKGKNPRFLQSGQTPPETFEQMWETLQAGQTWRGELVNRRKNGEIYWEYTVIASMLDETGQIAHYIAVKEDITARKMAEMELKRLVITDPLTGLRNRRGFFSEAEKIFARCQHSPYELAVLMMDIDHFKRVNDTYGHQAGDAVLREIAARLQQHLRPTDLIARYGGEEFVAMLPRMPLASLNELACRLNATVRDTPVLYDDQRITVTISIGAAVLTPATPSLDHLLTQADQAMYQVKHAGRNGWRLWQE